MNKFDGYFVQRKNPIFKRAKFNQRVQAETETVDQLVTALYALVEHCEYKGLKEQMIRDRLVVGLRDSKLSERLQMDSDLDLKKPSPWHGTAKLYERNKQLCGDQRALLPPQILPPSTKRLRGKRNIDCTSEREKLDRGQRDRLDRLSKQKLAPGVEGKLILAQDVQLVMPHTPCARRMDISQLCASQVLISQWELSLTTRATRQLFLELFTIHQRHGQRRHSSQALQSL